MLCKNCGRELPISGKFCPFCGAPTEQTGVDDETTFFTPLSEDDSPIDTAAFDAAFTEEQRSAHASAGMPEKETAAPKAQPSRGETPPARRNASAAPNGPRTTYFEQPDRDNQPYKKPGAGKKAAIVVLVIVLIAAVIGGGVWFVLSRKPDENLTLAEKYMNRGKFSNALDAYKAAQAEAKDPTAMQLIIDQLGDYQDAQDYLDAGEYESALALLSRLQERITDKTSPLADAVEDMIAKAKSGQSDSKFASDLQQATSYIDDKKYDAAAGVLDSLSADDSLTSDQKSQVDKLRERLTEEQAAAKRQEENQQAQQQQKQTFVDQMDKLEESDGKITSAETIETQLDATATSFEAWDTLLADMYTYLETVLSADAYASEEESYNAWVKERDAGAENAAKDAADETAGKLASASFKQSYTKTRCYKLLDLM